MKKKGWKNTSTDPFVEVNDEIIKDSVSNFVKIKTVYHFLE